MKIPTSIKRWSPLFFLVLIGCLVQFKSVVAFTKWLKKPDSAIHQLVDSADNLIQVALLLDTSGSMDGLIEQAKSQLWQILNQLGQTEKNNEGPRIEIALYQYGNDGIPSSADYIQQVLTFTNDMDAVSDALFQLRTNGGEEYCGKAINNALEELPWSNHPNNLRLIYIAGNEGFDQGPLAFNVACKAAKKRDIMVNTIFCGPSIEGMRTGWQQAALLTGGHYANIDHNEATAYIETPFDQDIARLNIQLNSTYIPFGQMGLEKCKLQTDQDANALQYSLSNVVDRAVFKTSGNYENAHWDLVDAYAQDSTLLTRKLELTGAFGQLSKEELKAKIAACKTERDLVSSKINLLNAKRQSSIAKISAENGIGQTQTLKNSVLQSFEGVAKQKGFKIK